MCTRSSTRRFSTAAWRPAARRRPAASYMTTNEKIRAIAKSGEVTPAYLPTAVARPATIALWLLGIPPVSASTRRFSLCCRIEVSVTLATWQIVQAMIGASRYFTSSRAQLCGEGLRLCLEGLEPGFGVGQQPPGPFMRGNQLVEWGRAIGEPADRLLEARQQLFERGLGLRAQVTVAATRPRIPLTKRPASSPEKVLASSIDSLIAALVGTRRSIVISYTAIRSTILSTLAICSSFQLSDASLRMASSLSRLASTPRTSWPANAVTSAASS